MSSKYIICGSRGISGQDAYDEVDSFMDMLIERGLPHPTMVVSGMCPDSPDMAGLSWAHTWDIPTKEMPARWMTPDGERDWQAGRQRNIAMAEFVGPKGYLVALWDGKSKGTCHMIVTAQVRGMRVLIRMLPKPGTDFSTLQAEAEAMQEDMRQRLPKSVVERWAKESKEAHGVKV